VRGFFLIFIAASLLIELFSDVLIKACKMKSSWPIKFQTLCLSFSDAMARLHGGWDWLVMHVCVVSTSHTGAFA